MKITPFLNQPIFKAHSYQVEAQMNMVKIQTDNENKLGNAPYLVYQSRWGMKENKMNKEGDLYTFSTRMSSPDFKYHILYKDSGNVDLKNGKNYEINTQKMLNEVIRKSRETHRQPNIFTVKEGKTIGRLYYQDNGNEELPDINTPTILITRKFRNNTILENPNIVGIIYTTFDFGSLSHETTRLRNQTNVCGAIFEPETIEKLISLDGKNIELELKDDKISFKETDKIGEPIKYPHIDVPELKPSNRILTSKEYTPDLIGAKAVNLRRLEELKEDDKIDVIIPKSIALTSEYLKPFVGCDNDYDKFIKLNEEFIDNGRINEIVKELRANGIEGRDIIVRSAFNGEDLPNFSAAGLYESRGLWHSEFEDTLLQCIMVVADSKDTAKAHSIRKLYGIPDESIQLGVILQQQIVPDYKFTLYTDDKKGNLKIDLYSDDGWRHTDAIVPHTFTYNRENNTLTYDSIQIEYPVGKFDENQVMESITPPKHDLSGNKELFEQLKKVAQNALVVEKEFGAPQDIEGGIKDGEIYFWQSRNIVN